MKRTLTAILCAALVMLPVQPARTQMAPLMFVLACVATGCVFVVYVYSRGSHDSIPHKLVLQKSHYDGQWSNVATNYAAPISTTNSISLFWDYMTDDTAQYRVADLGRLDKPQRKIK